MRMDPQHHPPWIWNNHQRQWRLWRSHGNTIPTKQFVFQNYNYVTFVYHSTETKKRSGQTGGWGKENIYWDGGTRIATGTASISKFTPLRILFTSSMTAHSILSCTKPGNKIPYPPTNVTTTRDTRKPDPHWRWQWRNRQTKQRLLHCRVDLFHASLLPPTLSRMHQLTTSILWMSTIHMWSLLSMSPGTSSIWLSGRTLRPVTSTIVGDIVMNYFSSLTHVHHALPYSFSFMIDRHSPQGKHAFYICLFHFYLMFYMCSPQG